MEYVTGHDSSLGVFAGSGISPSFGTKKLKSDVQSQLRTDVQSDRATPRRQTQTPQNLHPCHAPSNGNLYYIETKKRKQKRSDPRNTRKKDQKQETQSHVQAQQQNVYMCITHVNL